MTSLTVLKRRSISARQVWQLIRIATLARSPQHAFNLAHRMGWGEHDCHSTAALAKIYFGFGQQTFENAVFGAQGRNSTMLCLCECHRAGAPCGCCNFFSEECLCNCHECQTCNGWGWDGEVDEVCSDPNDNFCENCSRRHDDYDTGCGHPYGAYEIWCGCSEEDDEDDEEYEGYDERDGYDDDKASDSDLDDNWSKEQETCGASSGYISRPVSPIEPKAPGEDWSDYQDRLSAQQKSQVPIKPRANGEDWSDYRDRLRAQENSRVSIEPKAPGEDWSDYRDRLSAQQKSQVPIKPRANGEDWSDYRDRLRAQENSRVSIEPKNRSKDCSANQEKPAADAKSPAQPQTETTARTPRRDDQRTHEPSSLANAKPAAPCGPLTTEERVQKIAARLAAESGFDKSFKLAREIDGSNMQGAADSKQDAVLVTHHLVQQFDDDEIAFVLAHEIAHFEHDDSGRLSAYADDIKHDLISTADSMDARLKDKGRGLIVRALAQIGVAVVGGAAGYVAVHGKSREHERDADSRAVELMRAAGFDPGAAPRALRKLHGGNAPDIGILQTLGSTHPNPAIRVNEVARHAMVTKREKK